MRCPICLIVLGVPSDSTWMEEMAFHIDHGHAKNHAYAGWKCICGPFKELDLMEEHLEEVINDDEHWANARLVYLFGAES